MRDLDAMVAQLRGAGILVEVDQQRYPNGRFARTIGCHPFRFAHMLRRNEMLLDAAWGVQYIEANYV